MSKKLRHAMTLAAGLGTRLRPITDTIPKPLVEVYGRTLIDRVIDRLEESGVEHVVVNLHYMGELIEQHLGQRTSPNIEFTHEDEERLETGGGIANALGRLGSNPFYVANADILWLNGSQSALGRMADQWDDERMDGLLLTHSTVTAHGYNGRGDFFLEADGLISRRPEMENSPYLFAGIQILHPRLFVDAPSGSFSMNVLYDRAIEAGRLYGMVHDGEWFHVGTPEGLAEAEDFMKLPFMETRRR